MIIRVCCGLLFCDTLATAFAQMPCDGLKSLKLTGATITAAELVDAGPYRLPGRGPARGAAAQQAATILPALDDAERRRRRAPRHNGREGGLHQRRQPDLSAFKARGGRLLLYHGWNDPAIPPGNTVNYYSRFGAWSSR